MPGHGLQARGIAREQKMIYAGMTLFLEQGYERTTTAQIARKAGMSPASFFAAFENKEALLLRLTQIMFRSQFSRAEKMLPADQSPLLLYAMETGLQLHIAECSEPLRDLYVTAYSLPSTSDFINRSMTPRLRQIFSRWMKRADDSELFELEKYPALALEVQNGNIAGLVVDQAVGESLIATSNGGLEVSNFAFTSEEASFGKAVVAAKGSEDLLAEVNTVINQVVNDGSYLKAYDEAVELAASMGL